MLDRPTSRTIMALAIPMILSNLSVPLLGLVDTAVIGHLSHAHYLAGVALGTMAFTTLAWLFGFLRMATTGLAAQHYGADDSVEIQTTLFRGLLIATILGLVLLLLHGPIEELVVWLAQPSVEVHQSMGDYFGIRILGMPAALCTLVLLGWLLGMQDARSPMWLLILANSLNILLDLWFVVGLEWGVQGAAAASVIGEYASLGLGLWIVRRHLRPHRKRVRVTLAQVLDRTSAQRLFRLNGNIFLRSLCLQLSFSFLTIQGARLGDDYVATNAVLLNFLMFISYGLDGIAYAVEALVGKYLGQKDRQKLQQTVRTALQLAFVGAVFSSLVFAFAGSELVALLTNIESIRSLAKIYLPWLVLLPVTAVWCYVMDGVFIGATRADQMRNSMMFSTFAVYFPLWGLGELVGLDNHALWLALNGFMAARGLSLIWLYRRWGA